jgi:hypothetical protein
LGWLKINPNMNAISHHYCSLFYYFQFSLIWWFLRRRTRIFYIDVENESMWWKGKNWKLPIRFPFLYIKIYWIMFNFNYGDSFLATTTILYINNIYFFII